MTGEMLQIGRAPADWFDPELRRYSSMNAVIASLVRCSPRFSLSRVLTFDSPLGGYFNTSIAVSLGRAPCFRRLTNYQLSGPSTCDKFSLPIDCEVRLE